jgi:hypothetical protein
LWMGLPGERFSSASVHVFRVLTAWITGVVEGEVQEARVIIAEVTPLEVVAAQADVEVLDNRTGSDAANAATWPLYR